MAISDDAKMRDIEENGSKGLSYLLMTGHIAADINQGALIATLPFLVLHGGLSYTAVTALLFASNIASAIIQPLFGYLGDKVARPWFMALGITLAGVGMAGVGVAGNYWLILACAMVSGIGVAMFHPEGGRLANLVAGKQKGAGMSIFAVGGKLGFSIGPLMAAAALTSFGLQGTLIFLVPALLCAGALLTQNRVFASFGTIDSKTAAAVDIKDDWKSFSIVMGVISARSIIYYALTAFIPLFLVSVMGQTESFGSSMIALFAVVGVAGTLISGWASKIISARSLVLISYPLIALFVALFAVNQSLMAACVLIVLLSIAVDLAYPSSVALGQSFVPNHLGMASGLSFGVVVCVGGVASPLLGLAGDFIGLQSVMLILAAVAIAGLVVALFIPKPGRLKK